MTLPNFKKILFSIFFILLTNTFTQEKLKIAVIELEGNSLSKQDLIGLTNRLRSELFNIMKYIVIERSKMNEILKEQGFLQIGCTNTECAVEVGQLIGVEKIIIGNVDKIGTIFTVNLRMVDVATGKIEKTATKDCEGCTINTVLLSTIKNVTRLISGSEIEHKGVNTNAGQIVQNELQKTEKSKLEKENKGKIKPKKKRKRIVILNTSYSTVFGYKSSIGGVLKLGFKRKFNYWGGELPLAKIVQDTTDYVGVYGGIGIVYFYEKLNIKNIFIISPGITIGCWLLDKKTYNDSEYDKASYLFGGPKIKVELGYKKIYLSTEYSLFFGTDIENRLDIGLSFKL